MPDKIYDFNILGPLGIVATITLVWTIIFIVFPYVQYVGIKRQMKELSIREIVKQEPMRKKTGMWTLYKRYEMNENIDKFRQKLAKIFASNGLAVSTNDQGNFDISGTLGILYNVNYVNPLDFTKMELQLKSNNKDQVIVLYHVSFEKFMKFFFWFHVVLLAFLSTLFLLVGSDFGVYKSFYISLMAIFVVYFVIARYWAQILATSNFINKQLIYAITQN